MTVKRESTFPQELLQKLSLAKIIKKDFGFAAVLSPSGDWESVSRKKLALYRLLVLLSISEGKYPYDPEFGVKIPRYIFESFTDNNIQNIREEIRFKMEKYEKDLIVENINVYTNKTTKQISLNIVVQYIPTGEIDSLDFVYISELENLLPTKQGL